MDIRKIEYFIKVAEAQSISKAAAQIPISHQAISKQIQLLEEELGVKLLERGTTRVSLTEAGNKVYNVFLPLIRNLEHGYAEILEFIRYKKDTLHIGYFNGLSYHRIISPVIRELERRSPLIHVETLATDIGLVKRLLEQDSIDLAIYPVFDDYDWKNKNCFPIFESTVKIIVSENHPWYPYDSISAEILRNGNMLVYEGVSLPGEVYTIPALKVETLVPAYNFDTYMDILGRGVAFGIIGDSFSRREGNYKLFDLPAPYNARSTVIGAYKLLHPQKPLLSSLSELY